MFGPGYFGTRYFGPTYFPPGAVVLGLATIPADIHLNAKVTGSELFTQADTFQDDTYFDGTLIDTIDRTTTLD